MPTYASDAFDRGSDGDAIGTADVGGAWTSDLGSWKTNTSFNYAYAGSPSNDAHNTANLAVAQADVAVSVSVFTAGSVNRIYAGLYCRINAGAGDWVALTLIQTSGVDQLNLQQVVGYSTVANDVVTSFGITPNSGYTLKLAFSGSNIYAYVNGVLKLGPLALNAALTTQKYGIGTYPGGANDAGSVFQSFLITEAPTYATRPLPLVSRF